MKGKFSYFGMLLPLLWFKSYRKTYFDWKFMIGGHLGHLDTTFIIKGVFFYYLSDKDKIPFIKFGSINISVSHC